MVLIMKRAKEIERLLNSQDTWDLELLKELCELAGLEEEWQESDGDNFETAIYKAAEILGIDI